jgi:amino acid permease
MPVIIFVLPGYLYYKNASKDEKSNDPNKYISLIFSLYGCLQICFYLPFSIYTIALDNYLST